MAATVLEPIAALEEMFSIERLRAESSELVRRVKEVWDHPMYTSLCHPKNYSTDEFGVDVDVVKAACDAFDTANKTVLILVSRIENTDITLCDLGLKVPLEDRIRFFETLATYREQLHHSYHLFFEYAKADAEVKNNRAAIKIANLEQRTYDRHVEYLNAKVFEAKRYVEDAAIGVCESAAFEDETIWAAPAAAAAQDCYNKFVDLLNHQQSNLDNVQSREDWERGHHDCLQMWVRVDSARRESREQTLETLAALDQEMQETRRREALAHAHIHGQIHRLYDHC
jgi:hypothetical protein